MSSCLAAVRVARGFTQTELAERSGVSQGEISNLESGRRSTDVTRLALLATALEVPADLITREAPVPRVLHHLQVSLPSRAVRHLHAELTLTGVRLDLLTRGAPRAEGLPSTQGAAAEEVARALRETWRVPAGPIANLVALVESHGIPCLVRDLSALKTDALGNWRQAGRPFLVLNASSPQRKRRLAIAHELGHVLEQTTSSTRPEDAADAFAFEFLMPRSDIDSQFWNLTWSRLGELEEEWGVPAASIARHAHGIGSISATRYRRLRAELLDMGSDAGAAKAERPTFVANAIRGRGVSLGQVAAEALTSADELRRDFLAGAEVTRSREGGFSV